MDFSEYGPATKEWLDFAQSYPDLAADGKSHNDPTQASETRRLFNEALNEKGTAAMSSTGLGKRTVMSTRQLPSRGSHQIPLRVYKPKDAKPVGAVVYFQGGGFLFGDETTDDLLCANIANTRNTTVLNIIYRHTPDHKHPAQLEDALDAFAHIRENLSDLSGSTGNGDTPGPIAVMGISAGAALATAVVHRDIAYAKANPDYHTPITGAVLSIPWLLEPGNYPYHLFTSPEVSAKEQNKEAAVIPSARVAMFRELVDIKKENGQLLDITMLPTDELSGWPPTAFLVAGADPLRDDALLFARTLEKME